ncbi:MAG: hypothetical protein OCD01_15280 [Fibrobacterales bacterium]
MKPTNSTFAKSFPYMLLNFLPKRYVKSILFKRTGLKSQPVQFGGKGTYNSILVIAPHDPSRLSRLSPFVNQLIQEVGSNKVHILCAQEQKDIVQSLKVELITLPLEHFKYGDKRFKAIAAHIRKSAHDLVIYLENSESYPKLFLSCVSGAEYRVGINCEKLTPFLNISLNLKSDSEFNTLFTQLKMHVGI